VHLLTTSAVEEEPGVVCVGVVLVTKDGVENGDERKVDDGVEEEEVDEGEEVVEDGGREKEVEEVEEEKEALDCGPLPKSRPPTNMRSTLGFLPEMVPETSELKSGFTSS
jgi:hypothetical protein